MIGVRRSRAYRCISPDKYVAGAYIVFLAIVLIYVVIMVVRQARTERDLAELRRELEERERSAGRPASRSGDGAPVSETPAHR